MYRLVHWLKDTFPFLWEIIEGANSWFFGIRYGSKLKIVSDYLSTFNGDYQLREAIPSDTDMIVRFFKEQPEHVWIERDALSAGVDSKIDRLTDRRANGERPNQHKANKCFFHGLFLNN